MISNNDEDTIAAIATAHGQGSISIIRLSGQNSLEIIKKLTTTSLTPRYAHLCHIYDKNKAFLDEAIVIYFKAPFSFSGEDIVEIQCHGGVIMAKLILNACLDAGARIAQNGEFSKRAFINGKMDLSKLESISSLISAKNEHMVKLIANNLKGDLGEFVAKVRTELVNILAYSEVSIDYGEEDLPPTMISDINTKLKNINTKLKNIQTSSKQRLTLLDGYKIALIGKPNVGKSSLLNELLQYNRAIVSPIAGTTTDTIEDNMIIGSKLVRLIDTAGIRESSGYIENIGIEKTMQSLESSDIIIALFDSSKNIDDDDAKIISLLEDYSPKIIVFTKSDLENKIDKSVLKQDVKISCKNKDITSLIKAIEDILEIENSYDDTILTSQRQINIIENTINNIDECYALLEKEELELFSYHIKEAIEQISQITKSFEYGELLDEIFGNFCLGK